MHSRHIIHRDLKPENFVVGNVKTNSNTIFLIDLGLSRRFRNEKTGEHIPYKDNRPFIGNARFASIYAHLGIEQSRRDDLISLAFIILYFFQGSLPWQGIKCKTLSEKNQKVFKKKFSLTTEEIFKNSPCNTLLIAAELLEFYHYCINLQFDEKPDYNFLKTLIKSVANRNNFEIDNKFDWKLMSLEQYEEENYEQVGSPYRNSLLEEFSEEEPVWINE